MDVTLTTILYQPDWSRTGPIIEQNLAALDACGLKGELLIVDNSPMPTIPALELAARDERVRRPLQQRHQFATSGRRRTVSSTS